MTRRVCEVTKCRKWKNTKPTKMSIASVGFRLIGEYGRRVWLCPSHHREAHRTVWQGTTNVNTNVDYTASTIDNWFRSSGTTANC